MRFIEPDLTAKQVCPIDTFLKGEKDFCSNFICLFFQSREKLVQVVNGFTSCYSEGYELLRGVDWGKIIGSARAVRIEKTRPLFRQTYGLNDPRHDCSLREGY